MRQYLKAFKVYALVITALIGWWALAFNSHMKKNELRISSEQYSLKPTLSVLETAITAIDRNLLQQALAGDLNMMARLIADWDIDAEILDSKGFEGVKRISRTDFLHSQSLIRTLQNEEAIKKTVSILKQQNQYIRDETGKLIDVTTAYTKFLPQTYAAASFLLSLVPPEQIVALPRSMRAQTQLYPKSLTDRISLDIDRYNAEKLFLEKPEVAFVARYSHPAVVQALDNQGIILYTMKDMKTLPAISEELVHIGALINKPLQAELMRIFIDAALAAIDNQQTVLIKHFNQHHEKMPRVLVVNFHQNFSVPTTNTLTGQLLTRMQELDISLKYSQSNDSSTLWSVTIDKERLLDLDPDYLIIATENEELLAKEIYSDKALQKLTAVRHNRLTFIDDSIQKTPSQFIVLAYHDLIHALVYRHP